MSLDALFRTESLWDGIATDLLTCGVAVVENLPYEIADIHQRGFAVANDALSRIQVEQQQQHHHLLPQDYNHTQNVDDVIDYSSSSCVPWIGPDADSAHATGYHPAHDPKNGMSRYNTYREGFVFSDGNLFDVDGVPDFQPSTKALFDSLNTIAVHVLQAIDRKLDLPSGWLQENLGPTNHYSQWHIKRYVKDESVHFAATNHTTANKTLDDPTILLPVHTDPSLISVVVHDKSGTNFGAMGLEYYCHGDWIPVPKHGHHVATIFVGSVLSYLTGGIWPSAKHRVVQVMDEDIINDMNQPLARRQRMAATLFVRPRGTAMLGVPPSPHLAGVSLKKKISFDTWNTRVARYYEKKKKSDQTKPSSREVSTNSLSSTAIDFPAS